MVDRYPGPENDLKLLMGLLWIITQNGGESLNTSVLTKMPRDYTAFPLLLLERSHNDV
jgi:hypothetical protein